VGCAHLEHQDLGAVQGRPVPAPRRAEHGDWSTNVALVAAKGGGNPRAFAESIVERLPPSENMYEKPEMERAAMVRNRVSS
jgi:arginyl-tRNA synthetase